MSMEGTGQVNESLEDPAEAPRLKTKESDGSPKSNGRNMVELTGPFTSEGSEWHANISSLKSPEMITENSEDPGLLRQRVVLNSGSLGGSPDRVSDAHGMVEELTLKSFKYPQLLQTTSSNDGEETAGKGTWHSFYKSARDPCNDFVQEPETAGSGVGVENASFTHFWTPRSLPQSHSDCDASNASENASTSENRRSSEGTPRRNAGGVRTKVLPASGIAQYLVQSNLKGKRVAYRCHGSSGVPVAQRQGGSNIRMPGVLMKESQDVSQKSNSRSNHIQSLYGGGATMSSLPDYQKGVSLRFWLRSSDHRRCKSERFHIFRQILELVDASHSKGMSLQHLRPSYFMLLPPNQVRYTGSFISHKQVDLSNISMGQDIENSIKRKRYYDQSRGSYGLLSPKHQKTNESQVASYMPELFESVGGTKDCAGGSLSDESLEQPSLGSDHNVHHFLGGGVLLPHISGNQPIPQTALVEEEWYASPEVPRGSACTHASNVYCLGVLFFEIFCCFESWEIRAASMSDLRHRILPSRFLSESPKEAGFCLWLLHPDPSSRPKVREVLQSNLFRDPDKVMINDPSLASLEEEDAEADILLHFLLSVKEENEKRAQELVRDVDRLRNDLEEIDKRHLWRIARLCNSKESPASLGHISGKTLQGHPLYPGTASISSPPHINDLRMTKNIGQLERAYFLMRSEVESGTSVAEFTNRDVLRSRDRLFSAHNNESEQCSEMRTDRLGAFFEGLCKYARYSRLEIRGSLRNGDIHNSANVICSLSFDRDEEYFAAAGVSKKIKIFEYESLLNDAVDVHYPAIEMSSRSRLSCVCWNGYIKNYLASTDYEGIVQLWDASTGQGFTQYTEHQKRAWSVDFSLVDPTKLASGGDDYSVKLWRINERNSTSTIRSVANVCCVQFSADSTNLLAFGSADYRIYCYDLRNVRVPWCTLVGHKKAVSYVRFVDSETLVSASTDNTLKIWDLKKTNSSGFSADACSLTLSGHTNEKNFIGLSVTDGYIACGSETNEVFTYYKSLPMPITSHKFGSIDPISGQEIGDDNGQFVSSVCWRGKSNVIVAANSSGSIKLLEMV